MIFTFVTIFDLMTKVMSGFAGKLNVFVFSLWRKNAIVYIYIIKYIQNLSDVVFYSFFFPKNFTKQKSFSFITNSSAILLFIFTLTFLSLR